MQSGSAPPPPSPPPEYEKEVAIAFRGQSAFTKNRTLRQQAGVSGLPIDAARPPLSIPSPPFVITRHV